jgi:hypothetical protein
VSIDWGGGRDERTAAREILTEANEASDGFAVTSAHAIASARRPPARPRPR